MLAAGLVDNVVCWLMVSEAEFLPSNATCVVFDAGVSVFYC